MHQFFTRPIIAIAMLMVMASALAEYPDKPIKLIVPASPGGGADFFARAISTQLSQSLGQSIVIENKAGASGTIAADMVSKSAPNGYTIFMAQSTSTVVAPHLYKKLSYDTLKDFVPITMVAQMPFALVVNPKLPISNLKELIAYAKANPSALNYSSSGSGSGSHVTGEMFNQAASIKMVHVPYKGAGPSVNAVISGEVQVGFMPIVTALPFIKQNRIRALAVTTLERSKAMPELPTLAELGLTDFDANVWFGLFAPAKTPQSIVNRLYQETRAAIRQPDVLQRIMGEGADPVGNAPQQFSDQVRSEYEKYSKLLKDSGITLE